MKKRASQEHHGKRRCTGILQCASTSSVFVELCEEDRGLENEKTRGELSVSMYGTRSAARTWAEMFHRLAMQLQISSDSWEHMRARPS